MSSYQTFMTFCINVPAMRAAALSLQIARKPFRGEKNYYVWSRKDFQAKKDRITRAFRNLYGFSLVEPEGGYFCLADISSKENRLPTKYFYIQQKTPADVPEKLSENYKWTQLPNPDYSLDYAYGIYLCVERSLTPWPLSGFYNNKLLGLKGKDRKGTDMIRLSLCKSEEVIERLEREAN